MAIQPLSARLIKPNFCFTLPPTQHHSSVETRNLFTITDDLVRFRKCKAYTKGSRWFPWPLKTNLGKKLLKLALKFDENKKKKREKQLIAWRGVEWLQNWMPSYSRRAISVCNWACKLFKVIYCSIKFLNSSKDRRKGLIWCTEKSSLHDQSVKYLIDQLKVQSELLAMGQNITES